MAWQAYDTARSHFVASSDEPRLRLHLRAHADTPDRPPVLFVHGATYASRLYDVPHPGASWMKAAAAAGFAAYALDIRGYGRSHSALMERSDTPYARATQAVADISDAVAWIRARHDGGRVSLVGGSWGSITTATFAAGAGADALSALVLYAPIFAETNAAWLGFLSDPERPDRFNPAFGAARLVTEQETRERWDAEIPDEAEWRREEVFQALVQSSLSDDPESQRHDPPAFRAPNGTLLDLWEAFNGRPLYAPEDIECPALLIRGGADTTSTRSDALRLFDRLSSENKRYAEVANGAHFASAETRGAQIFAIANTFLHDFA